MSLNNKLLNQEQHKLREMRVFRSKKKQMKKFKMI